jgi:hypothetical protein
MKREPTNVNDDEPFDEEAFELQLKSAGFDARRLVNHLMFMGADRGTIPVTVDGIEYEVIVQRKILTDSVIRTYTDK